MPRIPIIQRQQSIPGVSGNVKMDVGSAGMVGRAVAGFGSDISNAGATIGNALERRQKEMQEQDDAIAAMNLINAYNSDTQTIVEDFEKNKTGMDAYDSNAQYTEAATKVKENLLAGINNPRVRAAFEQRAMTRDDHSLTHLSKYEAGQRIVVRDQAMKNSLAVAKKDAGTGNRPLADIMKEDALNVTTMHVKGSLTKEEAADAIVTRSQIIAEDYLQGFINSPSYSKMAEGLRMIESGEMDQYLPQDKIEKFRKEAKQITSAMVRDAEHAETAKKAAEVEAFGRQIGDINEEFSQMFSQGKVTTTYVNKKLSGFSEMFQTMPASLRDNFTRLRDHWNDVIKTDAKRKEAEAKGEAKKENQGVMAQLAIDIMSIGNDPSPDKKQELQRRINIALAGGEISTPFALSLHGKMESYSKIDPVSKFAVDAAKNRFKEAKEKGLLGDEKDVANANYYSVIAGLGQWITANPGKDPTEFVDKMLEPYAVHRVALGLHIPGTNSTKVDVAARLKEQQTGKVQQFNALPPPGQYKGRTITDTTTGKKLKSDGTKWVAQ